MTKNCMCVIERAVCVCVCVCVCVIDRAMRETISNGDHTGDGRDVKDVVMKPKRVCRSLSV